MDTITDLIKSLQDMDLEELIAVSRDYPNFQCKAKHATLFRMFLSIHIQESFFGGLTQEEMNELDRVSKMIDERKPKIPIISKIWRGDLYTVQCFPNGKFFYNGQEYKSLSGVAKSICGKKVSGKHFFNIKKEEE
jgi:hypothetical protein